MVLTRRVPPNLIQLRLVVDTYWPCCEVVPQDGSASMGMEITDGDGLFHASFVAMRQL